MRHSAGHQFSQVPSVNIQRSVFNRSFGHKTTFNENYLVPFLVDEVLPGDTFNVKSTLFARLATPVVPFMDNMYLDSFYFFVPNRILWSHWEAMNGQQETPSDSTSYIVPALGSVTVVLDDLGDHFGLPLGNPPAGATYYRISALPFRAYNKIYQDWFKDENLIPTGPSIQTDDGPDQYSNYPLRKRCKRHDYFTSCLPWTQKPCGGISAVNLPLGTTAPVKGNGMALGLMTAATGGVHVGVYSYGSGVAQMGHTGWGATLPYNNSTPGTPPNAGDWLGVDSSAATSGLIADLSSATAATINSLRQAFQLQRLLERDARGGTRYTEVIRAHFGVVSPDARLQRSEYLGGSSQRIYVNPVPQTSNTNATTPQGNLAAYGVVADGKGGFHHSFTEHGIIIGLMCVRADLTYQRGLNRMWSRSTRWDFYWPALAHLGEQAVLNQEIFVAGTSNDDQVFGYQERYAEYRYYPSMITGNLRSNSTTPLDVWHLAQSFTACPTLGQTFIEEAVPVSRVIAVTSEPHFVFDSHIEMRCARPMPMYSVPGLVDHF